MVWSSSGTTPWIQSKSTNPMESVAWRMGNSLASNMVWLSLSCGIIINEIRKRDKLTINKNFNGPYSHKRN